MRVVQVLIPLWILTLLSGAIWDYDGDGAATIQEWTLGLDPLDGDVDSDELPDGHEIRYGYDPKNSDQDQDGVLDGRELRQGGSPLRTDSDGDSIPDRFEMDQDCNGDGIFAIATSDDDGDGIHDIQEPTLTRCNPDFDQDGIQDGHEGLIQCMGLVDCDNDGLPDAEEESLGFDRFRPDTRETGLRDGTVYQLEQAGNEPDQDSDLDGIPDRFETEGPIDWGSFDPRPGSKDLLVEYVRVFGPETDRFAYLNPQVSYQNVEAFFEEEGDVNLQWTETILNLPSEIRPSFQDPEDLEAFRALIARTTYAANPYVTTIFLLPQQEQVEPLGNILGATYLRSMLITIDLGAHVRFEFEDSEGAYLLRGSPSVESHITTTNVPPVMQQFVNDNWQDFRAAQSSVQNQRYVMAGGTEGGVSYTLAWNGYWFDGGLQLRFDNDQSFQLDVRSTRLLTSELTSTIAHEIGHTLGLCHPHEQACFDSILAETNLQTANLARFESTMSYASDPSSLFMTEYEWELARSYLGCAPQTPVFLVATGASDAQIQAAKYDPAFISGEGQRDCSATEPLIVEFQPTVAQVSGVPESHSSWSEPRDGLGALLIWVGGTIVLGLIVLAFAIWQPRKPKPNPYAMYGLED